MSYEDAMRQFGENTTLTSPSADLVMWNISAGLQNLTEALNYDLARIKQDLSAIRLQLGTSK